MEEDSNIVNAKLMPTNFFVYKKKKYPFNMNMFNSFSQYFNSNKYQIDGTDINLLDGFDEHINLTDSSITDFVKFCQYQKIKLTTENVPPLRKLAKKYEVPSLIEATEKYMAAHQKEFIIEFLSEQSIESDTHEYEEMIASNLLDYIKNDRLLSLPIPVLHRIVTKYVLKNSLTNNDDRSRTAQPPEFINFLLKCVDRRGREASVLFDQVDFGSIRREVVDQLLKENPDKFDFHFINCNYMKTVYELESELIEREERMKNELSQMKLEQKRILDENERMKREQEERKMKNEEEIQQKIDEIQRENDRIKQKQQSEMNELEKKLSAKDAEIQKIKSDFLRMFDAMRDEMKELKEKVTRQNKLIDQIKQKKEEIKKPSFVRKFSSESDPSGIISLLNDGVTLTAGGENNPNYPLSNIRRYDNICFYNCYSSAPSSESASYIKFDFGPSKKIDLYSYFIRSNGSSPSSYYHPKTWRIEGSNDDVNWTPLDRRVNDANLNGPCYQHNFPISTNNHGSESMRYRYIRYVQQDSWYSVCPYYVYISYFELFGEVFE